MKKFISLSVFVFFLGFNQNLKAQTCNDPNAHNFGEQGPCETCFDFIQNGDEEGVDCGGTNPNCPECPITYQLDVEGNALIKDDTLAILNIGGNSDQDFVELGILEITEEGMETGIKLAYDGVTNILNFDGYTNGNNDGSILSLSRSSGGRVGIGVSGTPRAPLEVNGDIALTDGTGKINFYDDSAVRAYLSFELAGLVMNTGSLGGNIYLQSGNNIFFNTNTGNRMTISTAGNVGINTSSPSATLDVNGSLKVSNMPFGDFRNVQWNDQTRQFAYDNSSLRYKENVKELKEDFETILDVQALTYTRPGAPDYWEIGFAAEEFHELGMEPLVEYMDGLPDGIRYDKIVVYLIPVMKKQQERIEEQQSEIEELKNLVYSLLDGKTSNSSFNQQSVTLTEARLYPNQPNPFSEQTLIRYYVPQGSGKAEIRIANLEGKVMKTSPIRANGEGQLTVHANALSAGTYFYSLIVDGELIATEKMILTGKN